VLQVGELDNGRAADAAVQPVPNEVGQQWAHPDRGNSRPRHVTLFPSHHHANLSRGPDLPQLNGLFHDGVAASIQQSLQKHTY
jgi:hypothetical protein